MSTIDDTALTLVLDDRDDEASDPPLSHAVTRARHDVERIRRGLDLAARAMPEPATAPLRRPRAAVPAVAAVVLLALGSAVLAGRMLGDGESEPAPRSPVSSTPGIAAGVPDPSLAARVAEADRIVVGTVTEVVYGELDVDGGLPYVLATVAVRESLKPAGSGGDTVVAFDYAAAGPSSVGGGGSWEVGQELLLFLVSDVGTVSEHVEPAHLQVAGGAGGRFPIVDGQAVAPFTLDQVRAAV